MKAIKKIIVVLLAGALFFGFTACSNGDDSSKELSNKTEQTDEKNKSETSKTDEEDKKDTSKTDEQNITDTTKTDEQNKTETSKTDEEDKTDTSKADEKNKTDESKTDEKDTATVSKTPVTKSDPSSKTYPFSGTTWVREDNSSYKFVFSESTYKQSVGGGMAINNMEYTVEKNGEGYIARSAMNKTTMTVASADATTATVFRTQVDMKTHKETDITETYIRQ